MTNDEMQEFLGSRLNYERKGMPDRTELRLDRVHALLQLLGSPHLSYPVVHVAGTKGKGSTCHLVASMLGARHGKVGLHTSPHFFRIEERFRINGEPAPSAEIAHLIADMIPAIRAVDAKLEPEQPALTYFEITTALTMLYFQRQAVDWAVIEVGMGGRLDSTNVVVPAVSVITSISMDHTKQLGNSLESIAREKAGIIKTGKPVVSGVEQPSVRAVIEEVARQNESSLRQLSVDFDYRYSSRGTAGGTVEIRTWRRNWPSLQIPLIGEHQARNTAVAAAVMDTVLEAKEDALPEKLPHAVANLSFMGRFQILHGAPTVILDVAHNDASVRALRESMESAFGKRGKDRAKRILIFASSADKDWRTMLKILADAFDHVILTAYQNNPRAIPASDLANQAPPLPVPVSVAFDPPSAWLVASELTRADSPITHASGHENGGTQGSAGLVCVTGSFYLVAEMAEHLSANPLARLNRHGGLVRQ
ncbi:MAG: folylpolyglutamate synthase/dihydrofolate synthase family protein [Planctomycetota bacterium]